MNLGDQGRFIVIARRARRDLPGRGTAWSRSGRPCARASASASTSIEDGRYHDVDGKTDPGYPRGAA